MPPRPTPIATIAADLAAGRTTSARLVDAALARVDDAAGEGARAFMKVYRETARAEAAASDALRAAGIVRSAVEGIPVSVKVGRGRRRCCEPRRNEITRGRADAVSVAHALRDTDMSIEDVADGDTSIIL